MRSIMLCNWPSTAKSVYTPADFQKLADIANLDQEVYTKEDIFANPTGFQDVDFIFSTWGMFALSEEEIEKIFPNVKCVFYGAGSVRGFAYPFLNRGIKVFSSWGANAVPVAEWCVAQILLANSGYFHTAHLASSSYEDYEKAMEMRDKFPGNYDVSVGIIGVGMIGKVTIELLRNFNIHVKAYSPSLNEEKAAALGVERSTIEEIFKTCQVVSNHMADLPQTRGMLNKPLFASMLPYATFINTGRGAQVVEEELAEVLADRPDLCAVLDVAIEEPSRPGHPFYDLPNCIMTPHYAGSLGNEVRRMGQYMVKEFTRYINNEPCEWEVTLKMMERLA